jgi:hypothetical protein
MDFLPSPPISPAHNPPPHTHTPIQQDIDVPPVIYSIEPTSGPSNGRALILVEGSGFLDPIRADIVLEGVDLSYGDTGTTNVGSSELRCRLEGPLSNYRCGLTLTARF